jgi:TP901 family phage tail tape measure protein
MASKKLQVQTTFTALGFSMRGLAHNAGDFQEAMIEAGANFPEHKINRGTEEFDRLAKSVENAAKKTEFSSASWAHGLGVLAKNQFEVNTALGLMPSIANLSTVSHMSLADSAKISANMLNVFARNATTAEEKTRALQHITSAMVVTADQGSASYREIAEAMSTAGITAKAAGQSMETALALLGYLWQELERLLVQH